MSTDKERPYPEGIAWDEAWRQRQRAERLEAALRETLSLATEPYGRGYNFAGLHRTLGNIETKCREALTPGEGE